MIVDNIFTQTLVEDAEESCYRHRRLVYWLNAKHLISSFGGKFRHQGVSGAPKTWKTISQFLITVARGSTVICSFCSIRIPQLCRQPRPAKGRCELPGYINQGLVDGWAAYQYIHVCRFLAKRCELEGNIEGAFLRLMWDPYVKTVENFQ